MLWSLLFTIILWGLLSSFQMWEPKFRWVKKSVQTYKASKQQTQHSGSSPFHYHGLDEFLDALFVLCTPLLLHVSLTGHFLACPPIPSPLGRFFHLQWQPYHLTHDRSPGSVWEIGLNSCSTVSELQCLAPALLSHSSFWSPTNFCHLSLWDLGNLTLKGGRLVIIYTYPIHPFWVKIQNRKRKARSQGRH